MMVIVEFSKVAIAEMASRRYLRGNAIMVLYLRLSLPMGMMGVKWSFKHKERYFVEMCLLRTITLIATYIA